ncbi:hypothetical protein F2Q70_00034892 [Brassica cretica]|uniref:Separase-like TPR repeats region domain-containing protein n=1 Tax=Brassica cretica TaxID=69181 RepID=A0A8S9G5P9_BRACR|nr:hypothetical protein F2Q68_00029827 [Brassica cretica]KAF2585312.1 hypothetical protein F2Q70_00034892 [Brassica cretica]
MTSPDDVGLLSLIESSHAGDIFASVSDYLRPFSTLQSTSRKRTQHSPSAPSASSSSLSPTNRSRFYPNASPPPLIDSDEESRDSARDLFQAYEL